MPIFIFPNYKSMATISCHSNQSSYLIGTKKQSNLLPMPVDAIREISQESASWLQRRCLKMLRMMDGRRRTDDGRLPIL